MFTKDTVIILGAGASKHYNYPTGEELVKAVSSKASEIIEVYHGERSFLENIPGHLRDENGLNKFWG